MGGRQASHEARMRRPESWRPGNLKTGIRRRERSLKNSMAHTPKPRPADIVRWRRMEAEIAQMRAALAKLWPTKTEEA